jgi:DNA excision repair protein ERCC-6-like 2
VRLPCLTILRKSSHASFTLVYNLCRTKDATAEAVALGNDRALELSAKLQQVYLRRSKEDTLSDVLPKKDERIVFCELSDLQKELYEYILEQPDFVVLRQKNAPCDCGVNRKVSTGNVCSAYFASSVFSPFDIVQFFAEYQRLRTKEEQIEYQRKNSCCYRYPRVNGGVDPKAVLWQQQHPTGEACEQCPSCTAFAAMSILYKLCTHVALLQVKSSPSQFERGSTEQMEAKKLHDRAVRFLPSHLLTKIPGGYFLNSGIMNDHFMLSGKMVVLDKLLRAISMQQGRVLLFAHSTKSLDLIENYIMSEGYSYLRMDGQTPNAKRKVVADRFRANPDIFLLMLSTKAMGLGLNLTVVRCAYEVFYASQLRLRYLHLMLPLFLFLRQIML